MKYSLSDIRFVLDQLRQSGLSTDDIARELELYQVKQNARGLRHMYSGKTRCRNVEYRALRDLLRETTADS